MFARLDVGRLAIAGGATASTVVTYVWSDDPSAGIGRDGALAVVTCLLALLALGALRARNAATVGCALAAFTYFDALTSGLPSRLVEPRIVVLALFAALMYLGPVVGQPVAEDAPAAEQ